MPDTITDLFGEQHDLPEARRPAALAKDFLVPPFSVLDARQGYWAERKRAWHHLGIKSEEGRGSLEPLTEAQQKALGFYATKDNALVRRKVKGRIGIVGTSVFDPVLAEAVYRWFVPPNGSILDPFAGGSVRGLVASYLGLSYVGVDLSPEQVEANHRQWAESFRHIKPPAWVVGDSHFIAQAVKGVKNSYDLLFACPPYYNLEVYSDDENDLSNAPTYEDFVDQYSFIINEACKLLKADRFAAFVVGNIRDDAGRLRDFVGDTVRAFEDAGLLLYNDAILVTPAGSLPMRARPHFEQRRMLVRGHQSLLVFVKGDAKKAATACGTVDTALDLNAAVAPNHKGRGKRKA